MERLSSGYCHRNSMRQVTPILSVLLLSVSGCDRYCKLELTDRELLDKYAGASLHETYDEHLRLVEGCTPPRGTLAARIADFGVPAKSYALSRLEPGRTRSFIAARGVVGMVNTLHKQSCTPVEFATLSKAAAELRVLGEVKKIYIQSARDSCFPQHREVR